MAVQSIVMVYLVINICRRWSAFDFVEYFMVKLLIIRGKWSELVSFSHSSGVCVTGV